MNIKEILTNYKDSELNSETLIEILSKFEGEIKSQYDTQLKEAKKNFNVSGSSFVSDSVVKQIEGKQETLKFFSALAKNDRKYVRSIHDSRAKALNETTGSAGGFLVPVEFDNMVRMYLDTFSQLRSRATVLNMSSRTLNLNVLTTSVTITKPGEAAALTASDPVFAEPILTARKRIGATVWSSELFEDAEIDIIELLAKKFAEAIGKDEQQDAVNSAVAGSQGLLTVPGVTNLFLGGSSTSGKTLFTNVDWDVLSLATATIQGISMNDALGISILMHPTVYHMLRISKAATTGDYFLPSAPSETNKPTAWGYEIVLLNEMPSLAATAVNTKFIVVTNLKTHLIMGDRSGMKVKILSEGNIAGVSLAETDQEAIRVTKRTGNTTVLQNGIVTISTSAS